MIIVNFKNLEPSEMAREAVYERLAVVIEKFVDLQSCKIKVTIEMHNGPHQAGPDLFSATVQIQSGRFRGVRISRSSANLYVAFAELADRLLERLNRHGDKIRVTSRRRTRSKSNEFSDQAPLELP